MRRIFDGLITAFALIFTVPTFLILLSWSAIPGDSLYPLKRSLENVTLLILSGTPLVPKASIQFTDRRLNEATTLLAKKGSSVGYTLLVAQAKQTQDYIISKNDKVDSATFIQNIDAYQRKIEQTRQEVISQANASGASLPATLVSPAPAASLAPIPVVPTPASVQAPGILPTAPPAATPVSQQISVTTSQTVVIAQENPQQVLQNLNQTQSQLEDIKHNLEQEQENDHGGGGNGGKGQGKGQGND